MGGVEYREYGISNRTEMGMDTRAYGITWQWQCWLAGLAIFMKGGALWEALSAFLVNRLGPRAKIPWQHVDLAPPGGIEKQHHYIPRNLTISMEPMWPI